MKSYSPTMEQELLYLVECLVVKSGTMSYCKLYMRTVLLVSIVKVHTAQSGLRIIGGRNALQDEFPYVVKLEMIPVNASTFRQARSITFCTASVLSATWTLTAAHCIQFLDRYSANHPDVKHKNMIRTQPNDDLFEILSQYKHPAFKGFIVDGLMLIENDIGMLYTESISLQQYAKVSAVDFSTVIGQSANAVGYGLNMIITKFKIKKDHPPPPPRPLKVLDLVVVDCPKLWNLYPAMCVAQRCGRNPTMCAGDSGGPLIHPSGIIAVTSVNEARDCTVTAKERSHTVGVLTAVSPYITWITSHVIRGH